MKNIKRKNQKNNYINGLCILIIILLVSTGCKKEEPIMLVEDYLILVEDEHVQENEVMVYVYQVVEEFEQVGGKEVWEFEDFSGGKSAIEVAKEAVFENVVRMKVLNQKSREFSIELTESKRSNVVKQARLYFDKMSESYKEVNKISYELVEQVFIESAVASEVALEVTVDFLPEEDVILEKLLENKDYAMLYGLDTNDILTEVSARHILFAVRELDQSGDYVTLTDEEKSLQYNLAEEVHTMAVDGVEFNSLVVEYSNSEQNEFTFSKAFIPDGFKESLSTLAEGEVSEIVEDESGYHLFKIESIKLPTEEEINDFESNVNSFEEELRGNIITNLRENAFNSLYEEWKQDIIVRLDKTVWDDIQLQID